MRKLCLFIADVDAIHTERVIQCCARHREIEIVGTEHNGTLALKRVEAIRPDVLLTDIQLPGLDGILLLKDLQSLPHPPIVIVCTHFYSEISIRNANRFGACYFLYKPVDYHRLPNIILECGRSAKQPRQDVHSGGTGAAGRAPFIRGMLAELGIPAKLCGSQYLIESLICLDSNEGLIRNLTKGLYADVARQMHTTAPRVERSLRSAIGVGYDRGAMRAIFPSRPSNKEFIEYLHQRLQESDEAPGAAGQDYVY